jgi:hypothetical protein
MGAVSDARPAGAPLPWTSVGPGAFLTPNGRAGARGTLLPVRSPLSRHAASPALRFLREALAHPLSPDAALRWRERLTAGGIVAEVAREEALRRALPLLARAVEAAGFSDALPAAERGVLVAARLSAEARARAVARVLEPLGAACAAEGVAPVLLKGVALHGDLYPDPALRPVSDVDLLVAPGSFPALRRALATAGLSPDPLTAGRLAALEASGGRESFLSDFVFRAGSDGLPVEAKLDPVQLGVPVATAGLFEAGARPSPRWEGFRVLAPAPMAVQQALHLARHDGSDLLWFAELAHGVRTGTACGTLRPEEVVALAGPEGLVGVVLEVFAEAERLFPGSVLPALRPGGVRGGAVPSRIRARPGASGPPNERAATLSLQGFHALAARRPGAALSALWRRAFPSPAYVAARLGLAPGTRVTVRHRARRLASLLRVPR